MSKLSEKYAGKVSAREEKKIQKAMEEQKNNRGTFKEVPAGEYPVIVDKLELGDTSWGDKQIVLWFKITDGEYKNSRIFYNGSFDDHFSHGINVTAMLLADMLDDEELTATKIAVILSHGPEAAEDFIADLAEEFESMAWDLDYDITVSKKTNSKGQPYKNMTYEIVGVYDR